MDYLHSSSLLSQVFQAFASVQLEDGLTLREGRAIDDHVTFSRHDDRPGKGTSWQAVSARELEKYSDAISFLDGKGIRYYLPAMMRHAISELSGADGYVAHVLVETLHSNYKMQKVAPLLTPRQIDVVLKILAFLLLSDDWCANTLMGGDVVDALGRWAVVASDRREEDPLLPGSEVVPRKE